MNTIDFGGRLAIHPGEALYLVGYSRTLQGAKKLPTTLSIAMLSQCLSTATDHRCRPPARPCCRKDDGEPMAKLRKPDVSPLQADIDDIIDQAPDGRRLNKRAGKKLAITVAVARLK